MAETRARTPVIELFSQKAFPNELKASEFFNISRYFIHKSCHEEIIVRNKLSEKCAFSYYYFGMSAEERLKKYY